MVALDVEDEKVNLLDVKHFNDLIVNPPAGVKVYTAEKNYKDNREIELFSMICSGCEISTGELFKNICLALE